jgi:H+/Na+-translocating ferredoxin:NAD+ oxidoreductase subunit G
MNDTPKNAPAIKGNALTQAWLVILLALLYGSALAGVHVGLSGKIADNIRNETYDQIPRLIQGTAKEQIRKHQITGNDGQLSMVYEARDDGGNRIGWVLPGSGLGFADRIDLLIGLDPQLATIRGMFVLNQKETPGLGNYITDADRFRNQFTDKRVDAPLVVVKASPDPEHEILALTGATISSESVSEIINQTIANLRQPILEIGAGSGAAASPEVPGDQVSEDPGVSDDPGTEDSKGE